jgi:antibiotic biosynthesis monooxygenase (ABM) superfamily enzyme
MGDPTLSERAVTVLNSRNVKPGCEAEFESATHALIEVAEGFKGYLGAQVVRPGADPDVEDTMYHVVLAFDHQSNLDMWHQSPERVRGLAAAEPLIKGSPSVRRMEGLGLWYRTTQPSPPRWKIAVVTWLGICPTVYVLFLLSADLLKSWSLLPRTVVLTIVVVLVMTWLVAPQLTRIFRPWLFARQA